MIFGTRPALPILALLAIPCTVLAGEKDVPSHIVAAKVFLSGAQITRTAKATVPAGSGTLVLTGLAQGIDPQSIQVGGKGAWNILSVARRINYLAESPNKKEIGALDARIKKLEHDSNVESGTKAVWDNEEQFLQKNNAIGGQQSGVTASQLQAVNDYVRGRMRAIKAGQLAQTEKLAALNDTLAKLRQQVQQMKAQAPRPTSEVVIETSAAATTNATITLSYFVPNASWTPAYDLRTTGTDKPVQLDMKAQVVNNTGEDWDQVDLSLSSGNPTLGGVMPELQPWTLYRPRPVPMQGYNRSGRPAPPMTKSETMAGADSRMETQVSTLVPQSVVQRTTTMEFSIDAPFSVPADGLAHAVRIQSRTLPAIYTYYSTPKLDKSAFLYARTTGWEDLDLLSGEANIFFEGTFVGKSFLQLDVPKDTLDISLGRDRGITVDRVKSKATNEKAVIGSKRTVSIGWDITVRNAKAVPVDLVVRDQYPLSPQSEIEVKLTDDGGATVNKDKGMLSWKLHLAPKETKKLGFSYSVKYPTGMPVVLE